MKLQRAIISVWDKEGIVDLAQVLLELNIEILATGKTAELLKQAKIKVIEVSDYTGSPEILEGRVKTLHPKIAGGILSYRKDKDVDTTGIEPIDIVVCNLYPFEESLKKNLALNQMIEMIDIGGVTLLRAGAKNFEYVTVIPDKKFYPMIINELKEKNCISFETRQLLALKTFEIVAHYDSLIQEYFYHQLQSVNFAEYYTKTYIKSLPLRYGENPHQKAFYYQDPFSNFQIKQIQGKELSYNNLLDLDAVISIVQDFPKITCAIVKHNSPCGVATRDNPQDAYLKALESDNKSAFGGIVGFNCEVDGDTAKEMTKIFLEVITAPSFTNQALTMLKTKKNLRVVEYSGEMSPMLIRNCLGGILLQEKDIIKEDVKNWQVVSQRQPAPQEIADLEFAWKVVKFVKSNAIVLAKDKATIGIGAGQTSRIDAVEIAIKKAQGKLTGAVMASDGFFPFRDSIDLAGHNKIKAIIEPGGSINDKEVIEAANEHNITLLFTGTRHFRH
ncbi:MAG: bifunctional phosphoribosylaminoimidazolecarboxamide formyltransferase/IMP cyclohydrolase [candidate division WOR-3 bacterium]|nr:bifunctional phosphoribosylaminoimidazolecarboxamide formyltransferase/IMP cyclohydrolase [candidate division WOR-3 bacterium]